MFFDSLRHSSRGHLAFSKDSNVGKMICEVVDFLNNFVFYSKKMIRKRIDIDDVLKKVEVSICPQQKNWN